MTLTAQVLETAAALIGTHGWIQCELGDERSGFCAAGGIYAACDLFDVTHRVISIEALSTYINRGRDVDIEIPDWNDAAGRTESEVIDTLLAAANDAS